MFRCVRFARKIDVDRSIGLLIVVFLLVLFVIYEFLKSGGL